MKKSGPISPKNKWSPIWIEGKEQKEGEGYFESSGVPFAWGQITGLTYCGSRNVPQPCNCSDSNNIPWCIVLYIALGDTEMESGENAWWAPTAPALVAISLLSVFLSPLPIVFLPLCLTSSSSPFSSHSFILFSSLTSTFFPSFFLSHLFVFRS